MGERSSEGGLDLTQALKGALATLELLRGFSGGEVRGALARGVGWRKRTWLIWRSSSKRSGWSRLESWMAPKL